MRILGQQRMNSFGYNIVQDYKSRTSHLNYRDEITIPLLEKSGILMVKSIPWGLRPEHIDVLGKLVMNSKDKETDLYCYKMKSDITA